jgi:polyisoprenoid-binding protein YceI
LIGNLTIRDIDQPAVWDVEAVLQGEQLTGKATTFISLSDYGITPPVLEGVREALDDVTILVDFTFAKYEAPPSGST